MRKSWRFLLCAALLATLLFLPRSGLAQSPVRQCAGSAPPPWCAAAQGDRPSGWLSQGRSEVMARHGIVATSQPLAAQAGLRVLMAGGNAIDAAVATAAVLNLVEPMMVGAGGDLFAIFYIAKEKKLYQLNAAGMMPTGATVQRYNSLGYVYDPKNWGYGSGMPVYGILSAPVPSAAWGWDEALRKFGSMTFKEVLQPAIDYAENGFPISEVIGSSWRLPNAASCSPQTGCTQLDPDSVRTWYLNGQPPKPGDLFRNPELARTFRLLQQGGRDAFYKGEIARAIVAKSAALGGTMTLEDLANYYGEWVTPPSTSYHGYDVYETAAPSQAWNTLEILNILEVCVPTWVPGKTLADLGPANPQYWHLLVEAKKLAFIDLYKHNSDPRSWDAKQQQLFQTLISKEYAATLCKKVQPNGPAFVPAPTVNLDRDADTIYLTTADRWGNMVSWVNSNFTGFGTGVTIPGYGFVLNSRGAQFTLDPHHPNAIAPGKRPYDTISAGFVMKSGEPVMTVGVMGGDMQPQGHAQVLVNVLDLGANVQAATDMARFYHNEVSNKLFLESQLYNRPVAGEGTMGAALKAMGHDVSSTNGAAVGGYQAIMFTPDPKEPLPDLDKSGGKPINGFYRAGSDHRKDGGAVGW
jgi:gamma-glutamyltranspeptidase / glutathione hydrolase